MTCMGQEWLVCHTCRCNRPTTGNCDTGENWDERNKFSGRIYFHHMAARFIVKIVQGPWGGALFFFYSSRLSPSAAVQFVASSKEQMVPFLLHKFVASEYVMRWQGCKLMHPCFVFVHAGRCLGKYGKNKTKKTTAPPKAKPVPFMCDICQEFMNSAFELNEVSVNFTFGCLFLHLLCFSHSFSFWSQMQDRFLLILVSAFLSHSAFLWQTCNRST